MEASLNGEMRRFWFFNISQDLLLKALLKQLGSKKINTRGVFRETIKARDGEFL